MKNLLNSSSTELLVQRVNKLEAHKQPLWGKMNATEMLLHCNIINASLLVPGSKPTMKTSIKQFIIRMLVLYVMPNYPRNAKAPKQVETGIKTTASVFEDEKQTFVHLLKHFSSYKGEINHCHPYFGNLSTKQWGRAMWKHTDHHLRQFGI